MNIGSANSIATNADSLQSILRPFRRLSWNCETHFVPVNCNFLILTLIYFTDAGRTLRVRCFKFDIW